ncbi:unnamed protein product [Ilex paraguariensis]|uniref:Uncharacterized protein n=1 Tax=Ilex paraguariensis TaxID=185542 RepID=A0ABC8R193_9AQUA
MCLTWEGSLNFIFSLVLFILFHAHENHHSYNQSFPPSLSRYIYVLKSIYISLSLSFSLHIHPQIHIYLCNLDSRTSKSSLLAFHFSDFLQVIICYSKMEVTGG